MNNQVETLVRGTPAFEEEFPMMHLENPHDPSLWSRNITFLAVLPEDDDDVKNFINDERYENFKYTRPTLNITLDPMYVQYSAQLFIMRMEASIVRRMQVNLIKNVKGHTLDYLHKDEWEYIKNLWKPYWHSISRKPISKRIGSVDYNGYSLTRMVERIFFVTQTYMPPLCNKKWYIKKWVNLDQKFAAQIIYLVVWYDELVEEVACSFNYHSFRKVEGGWEFA